MSGFQGSVHITVQPLFSVYALASSILAVRPYVFTHKQTQTAFERFARLTCLLWWKFVECYDTIVAIIHDANEMKKSVSKIELFSIKISGWKK